MSIKDIEQYITDKFPDNDIQKTYREILIQACKDFVISGQADSNFVIELCSGHDSKFWSCISEALLYRQLLSNKLTPEPKNDLGPDFKIQNSSKDIWIEVICPEPKGLSKEWSECSSKGAYSHPHKEILLRWTSAIKEKSEKLLGNKDKNIDGYIKKGVVSTSDSYVIAINGIQLRNGPFSSIIGISQLPVAVEVAFAIGPIQVDVNTKTFEHSDSYYQFRPHVIKKQNVSVSSHTFLDENFKYISAIWAVDIGNSGLIDNREPMIVVHNPKATNPVPTGLLPAFHEYVAVPISDDEYKLDRIDGLLK